MGLTTNSIMSLYQMGLKPQVTNPTYMYYALYTTYLLHPVHLEQDGLLTAYRECMGNLEMKQPD